MGFRCGYGVKTQCKSAVLSNLSQTITSRQHRFLRVRRREADTLCRLCRSIRKRKAPARSLPNASANQRTACVAPPAACNLRWLVVKLQDGGGVRTSWVSSKTYRPEFRLMKELYTNEISVHQQKGIILCFIGRYLFCYGLSIDEFKRMMRWIWAVKRRDLLTAANADLFRRNLLFFMKCTPIQLMWINK